MLAISRRFPHSAVAISEIESAVDLHLLPQTSGVGGMGISMYEESSLTSEFLASASRLGAQEVWGEEPSGSSSSSSICKGGDCRPELS